MVLTKLNIDLASDKNSTYTDPNFGRYFTLERETIENEKNISENLEKKGIVLIGINPKSTFSYYFSNFSLLNKERLTNRPVQIEYPSDEVIKIKRRNKNYNFLINFILNEIKNLEILNDISYLITIFIYKDVELPTWKQTVISTYTSELDIKDKLSLWKSVINNVYSTIKSKKNKILFKELKRISIEFK